MRKLLLASLIGFATIGFAQSDLSTKLRNKDSGGRGLSKNDYNDIEKIKVTDANAFLSNLGEGPVRGEPDPLLTSGSGFFLGGVTIQDDGVETISGRIGTFKINISAISSTQSITILIMRPNVTKTQWTPIQQATVSVTSVGTKTWTSSDFGTLTLERGDKVGILCSSSGINVRAQISGANYGYYTSGTAGPLVNGTTYNFTKTFSAADWQFNYTIANSTLTVSETQLTAGLKMKVNDARNSLGTTELTSTIFTNTTPSGWVTAGSGWSNLTDGLQTPNRASIDYSVRCARSGELYNTNKLKAVWRIIPQTSGARIGLGFTSTIGIVNGTMVQIDAANSLIKLHGGYATPSGTTELTTVVSSAMGALTVGREYSVTLTRDNRVFTAKIEDCLTRVVVGIVTQGDNNTVQSGWPVGNCQDTPAIWPLIGQVLIRQFSLTTPIEKPFVFLTGDSTTMGTGAKPSETWANMLIDSLGGRGINSGQTGAGFSKIALEVTNVLPKVLPKNVIMDLGFNTPSDTAGMRTAINTLKTWCDTNGAKLWVMVQWKQQGSTSMDNLITTLMTYKNVKLIYGNRAIGTNGDWTVPNSSLYFDTVHLGVSGNIAIYNQIKVDAPELFSN